MTGDRVDQGGIGRPYRRVDWALAGLLVLLVAAVYAQVRSFAYVNIDDPFRVYQNPHVLSGLSWDNLRWAFTNRESSDSYPLTWLSFQLVIHWFGPGAGPQHLVNVMLHTLNGLLVFHLFRSVMGRTWPSALVAALFALHPLHVESVAWVSGRKDVLSTLFWLLALLAYVDFVRTARIRSYLLVFLCFALGLLAKSMLVTLPCTLVLLDFWPLGRLTNPIDSWKAIKEKIPLFLLAGLGSLNTFKAQADVGAVYAWSELPLSIRLSNAATTFVGYWGNLCWPMKLAVFYPHPGFRLSLAKAVLAMAFIGVITLLAWRQREPRPYLLAGWLWFGLTILPVIGIVQIGAQAMADRYTYVSLLGPFWILAWGSGDLADKVNVPPWALKAGWSVVLAVCSLLSFQQVASWKNTRTLFEHAKRVTERNWMAHMVLGKACLNEKQYAPAVEEFRAAVEGTPSVQGGRGFLGVALMSMGKLQEAMEALRGEFARNPRDPSVNLCMGILHMVLEHPLASLPYLRIATESHEANILEIERIDFQGFLWLGRAKRSLGQVQEAREALLRAQKLEPTSKEVAAELEGLNRPSSR